MNKKYELIIFDLDGTLLDTSLGIFNSVRYAESQMGFSPIPDSKLKEFVGPPPKLMYMKLYGVDEKEALKAAKKHREYGRTKAIYEAMLYPGIIDTLETLKNQGCKLAVCTLKSQKIAETMLEHFGLIKYFTTVVGMDEKETFNKLMTIQIAKSQTNTKGRVLMIGDSYYDYDGAVQADADFLGVLYGFGFERIHTYSFPTVNQPEEILCYCSKC